MTEIAAKTLREWLKTHQTAAEHRIVKSGSQVKIIRNTNLRSIPFDENLKREILAKAESCAAESGPKVKVDYWHPMPFSLMVKFRQKSQKPRIDHRKRKGI